MPQPRKVQTGVSLDPRLMEYIDGLIKSDQPLYTRRPRSQVIALIIEEHARRSGVKLVEDGTQLPFTA